MSALNPDINQALFKGDINIVIRYTILTTTCAIGLPLVMGIILFKPFLGFLLFLGLFAFVIWTLAKFASDTRLILFYENRAVLKTGLHVESIDYSSITKVDFKKPYRDIDRMTMWYNENTMKVVFKIESKGEIDKKTEEIMRFIRSKNEKVIDLHKMKKRKPS